MSARQYKRFHPFQRSFEFVLLDRARRINMLRTNPRTFTDKRTSPDALRMREQPQPLLRSLITVVHVVALRQSERRGSNKRWLQSHDRTSRIAQRAIDAHAELFIEIQLLRSLQEFARAQRWLVLADQPRLYTLQLD